MVLSLLSLVVAVGTNWWSGLVCLVGWSSYLCIRLVVALASWWLLSMLSRLVEMNAPCLFVVYGFHLGLSGVEVEAM